MFKSLGLSLSKFANDECDGVRFMENLQKNVRTLEMRESRILE